jgi:hypothetical protein
MNNVYPESLQYIETEDGEKIPFPSDGEQGEPNNNEPLPEYPKYRDPRRHSKLCVALQEYFLAKNIPMHLKWCLYFLRHWYGYDLCSVTRCIDRDIYNVKTVDGRMITIQHDVLAFMYTELTRESE